MPVSFAKYLLTSTTLMAVAAFSTQAFAASIVFDGTTTTTSGALVGATGTNGALDAGAQGGAGVDAITYSGASRTGTVANNVTGGTGGTGSVNDAAGAPTTGGTGGTGGTGVNMSGGTTSSTLNENTGQIITGGTGGNGGAVTGAAAAANEAPGAGGAGGAGIIAGGTTLNNINISGTGSVVGGQGGNAGALNGSIATQPVGGAGGAGVSATDNTNITFGGAGTITGGAGGTGGSTGAAGSGISFSGTGKTLNISGNGGTITGGNTGAGTAISVTGTNTTINNGTNGGTNGSIIGGAGQAGDAINVNSNGGAGAPTIINNYGGGTIRSTGANAIHVTAGDTVSTLTNAGTIQAAGTAIQVDATGAINTINNTGIITGTTAVNNSGGNLTLNNTGAITGALTLTGTGVNTVNISNGGTVAGAITGAGGDDIVNVSTNFTTGGAFTNVGTTNINSGIFNLNNASTGNGLFNVVTGSTLNLNANLGSTNLTNAGTTNIANGVTFTGNYAQTQANAITTLTGTSTITGNYNQTAGTLGTNITAPTTYGAVTASGTGNIGNGSIINMNVASGVNAGTNSYNILTATGGLTANPAGLIVTSNNAFFTFTPTVVAGTTLRLNTAQATVTEAATHSIVNAGFTSSPGVANLGAFEAAAGGGRGGQNAYSTLIGYTGLMNNLQNTDFNGRFTTLNNQIGALQGTALTDALTSLQPTAGITTGIAQSAVAANNTAGNVVFSHLDSLHHDTGIASGDSTGHGLKVWAQPYVAQAHQDAKDGVEGYSADTYGALFGGDVSVAKDIRVGLAFGYDRTIIDASGALGGDGASIQGYQGSVYGTYTRNNFYLDGLLGLKYNDYDTKRQALGTEARADFDGWQYSARAEAGYDFDAKGLILTPNVSFTYSYLDQSSYTETGGILNNSVESSDNTSAMSEVGVKLAYPVKTTAGTFTPKLRTGWLHEFGDKDATSTSSFVGGSQSYVISGTKVDADAYHVGGGLSYELNDGVKLSADADYVGRSSSDDASGFLRVKLPL